MFKERPILFNGEMVRAILQGRKTQTRRILKQPKRKDGAKLVPEILSVDAGGACPLGQVGDRLWVRETWAAPPGSDRRDEVAYRADNWHDQTATWSPSIHMPRWASRITLEITAVRAERLQDISEADARDEGAPAYDPTAYFNAGEIAESEQGFFDFEHRAGFFELWQSLDPKRGFRYSDNPWMWVIEFKVLEVNRAP